MRLLRSQAESHCERLLGPVAAKLSDQVSADLHSELVEPVGISMMSDILGVPQSDRTALTGLIHAAPASVNPTTTPEVTACGNLATDQVERYFVELAAERRRSPREDLVSLMAEQIVRADDDPEDAPDAEGISRVEYLSMLWGLWVGGAETTIAGIDHGIVAMVGHPEQAGWLDGDQQQIAAFVAEAFRHHSALFFDGTPPIATQDVELSGAVIPEGGDVRTVHPAANRDPAGFARPDLFDPARDSSSMVTFGHGNHHCLGAVLARMESEVVLGRVHADLPTLALIGHPVFRPVMNLWAFSELLVVLQGRG